MSIYCKTINGKLEEVTEQIFELRNKIVLEDGTPRYSNDYFIVSNGSLKANGEIDRDTFSLLGRSLGVKTESQAKIEYCPEFLPFKKRAADKIKLVSSKTGQIWIS